MAVHFSSGPTDLVARYRTAQRKEVVVGAIIMLGSLFALIAVIVGLVLFFDPEARRASTPEGDA